MNRRRILIHCLNEVVTIEQVRRHVYLWHQLELFLLTSVVLRRQNAAISQIFTYLATMSCCALETLLFLHVHRAVNLHALATVGSLGARGLRLLSLIDSRRCLILVLRSGRLFAPLTHHYRQGLDEGWRRRVQGASLIEPLFIFGRRFLTTFPAFA